MSKIEVHGGLPAGTILELVDNTNLSIPVGAKLMTSFNDDGDNPICTIDGEDVAGSVPLAQCKIVGMSKRHVYVQRRSVAK